VAVTANDDDAVGTRRIEVLIVGQGRYRIIVARQAVRLDGAAPGIGAHGCRARTVVVARVDAAGTENCRIGPVVRERHSPLDGEHTAQVVAGGLGIGSPVCGGVVTVGAVDGTAEGARSAGVVDVGEASSRGS
jgi:hypothetical protein